MTPSTFSLTPHPAKLLGFLLFQVPLKAFVWVVYLGSDSREQEWSQ